MHTTLSMSGALRCAALIVLASALAGAQAQPPPTAPAGDADGLTWEWFDGLQSQLAAVGLHPGVTNAAEAVALGLLQQIDPRARIADEEEEARISRDREGRGYSPGLRIGITNGRPLVLEVQAGSPAAAAGLAPDDIMAGIGPRRFDKIALPEAQRLLYAEREEAVAIRYVRAGITNTVEVPRALLPRPAIEHVELLPNNLGYIKLNGLYENSGRDIVSRIRAWSEARRDGAILDLRGAGGGFIPAVIATAGLFCPGGQFLFAFRDHEGQDLEVARAGEGKPVDLPVMVLVDRHTTGAAEVLAAALNASARNALLIGEPTAGDLTLREPVTIAGRTFRVAVKVLDTADGIRYTGKSGVMPAIILDGKRLDTHDYEPPEDLLDTREVLEEEMKDLQVRRRLRGDGMLEHAADILTGLKSLNKDGGGVFSPDTP